MLPFLAFTADNSFETHFGKIVTSSLHSSAFLSTGPPSIFLSGNLRIN